MQRSFAAYGPGTWLEPTTNCPSITRTVALFTPAPAQDTMCQHSTVLAAAVGVVYRRPALL